jgi:hypothetical protein
MGSRGWTIGALALGWLLLLALGGSTGDVAVLAQATTPTPPSGLASPHNVPADAVAGIVQDARGPIAGAVVRVQLTENKTTTAPDGRFLLSGIAETGTITITAWSPGYYVGWTTAVAGTAPVTITMKPHYTTDNPEYDWFEFEGRTGSAACALCHTQYPEWAADAHAQAAVNPRFLSLYKGTDVHGNPGPLTRFDSDGKPQPLSPDETDYGPGFRLDYPNRAGNCAACHTPMASKIPNTQNCGWSGCHTNVTTEWSRGIIPPAPSPLDLSGTAAEGIGCDFCHKIGEVYLNPETGLPYPDMPGILSMRLYRPPEGQQLFFGTFDDIPRRDTYLPLEEESAFCAPCHYGVFGGIVGSGTVKDGVDIYTSYEEWLNSPYSDPETGQTCQDCHMPVSDLEYIVYPERGGLPRPNRLHDHRMAGASDPELLQNSVTMTTTAQFQDGALHVAVAITNDKTGHHVPTDVPLRHMILVVEAFDADGNRLVLSEGPALPEWAGSYAGAAGKVYARVLQDQWTGETPTAAYWRPVKEIADTRLAAFATDITEYVFPADGERPVTVEARLIFRRAYQKLMEQKGWQDPDIVMEQARVTVLP